MVDAMSLAATRQEIADIISSIPDCEGYLYRPTTLNPGDGFILLDGLADPMGENFRATWRIPIVLPGGDEQQAMEWFDNNYEPIADAFDDAGFDVDSIEPYPLGTEAGVIEVMLLTVRREA